MTRKQQALPDVVIRASAGTGKTFQLSNRFLHLALDETPLETILAATFTRKAAGEILDRVLFRLAEAALDEEKLVALGKQLVRPELDRAQCLNTLQTMVRQLHRLRVGTIDSVFVQIARSFSLELGLPPGWQICDEPADRRLRAEAIREMLQRESADESLRLMHLLGKGEAARSVTRQVFDLVDDLYQIYADSPAEAWSALGRRKSLSAAQLAAALETLRGVALPKHKKIAEAHEKDVARVEAKQWEAFLSSGVPKQICAGKTSYYRKEITGEMVAAYEPLVEHATAQVIGAIAAQTEATHEMLARFETAYDRLQMTHRAIRFDDVTRRLGEATADRPIEQVVYRLDARLAHLLLDEFQDTSPAQWRVLRPFARRIVDRPGETFFCVGDVKQAIYGWRGGVAEIFEAIPHELKELKPQQLNESYRSSPVVIDLVNQVFSSLVDNDALNNYPQAARAWAARFRSHSTACRDLPGYGRLESAPLAEEGEKPSDVTLDFAARRIAALRAAAPGRSIGVLVRRNKSVARLIHRLRRQGVPASEEGGNPLGDCPAVQLLLSLMRLADHPGDSASRFHVARSPLAEPLDFERFDDDQTARRLSTELRRRLLADGYGPTVYDWTNLLAPHCDPRDWDRLMKLVEMAYDYDPRATMRADDFVDWVAEQRVEDPSSSDVRVMTVHQAKGLEFDVVVLPELDYNLLGQPPRLVVGRAGPTEPAERVCRYVGEKVRPILPRVFVEMFETDQCQRVEESLCLLYVALTRAVHALHIIVGPSRPSERQVPSTPAGLLRVALAGTDPVEPERILFEQGDPNWAKRTIVPGAMPTRSEPEVGHVAPIEASRRAGTQRGHGTPPGATAGLPSSAYEAEGETKGDSPIFAAQKSGQSPAQKSGQPPVLAEPARRVRRGLDRRSPSHLEGGPRVELASRLRFDTSDARQRGTVMHAWFEQVGWLEDGPPADELLWRIARGHTTDEPSIRQWMTDFHAALERPEVQAVLSRAAYAGRDARIRLWRERPFAVRQEDAILSGAIDRLVVLYDGTRPVGADVLDFKTDRVPADDPAAIDSRVEFYRPQMEAYTQAVGTMFDLPAERISARLIFVEPGVVRAV